jgi:hypothetical protein
MRRLKASTPSSKPTRTVNDIIFAMTEQRAKDLLRAIVVAVEEADTDLEDIQAKTKAAERRAAGFTAVREALVAIGEPEAPVEVPVMSDDDYQTILRKDVEDAKARVKQLEQEEEDADNRCMGTPEGDRDLQKYRDHSIKVGHSLEQAREDLVKAERDLRLLGR